MRKLAFVLIGLLLFQVIAPYQFVAAASNSTQVNEETNTEQAPEKETAVTEETTKETQVEQNSTDKAEKDSPVEEETPTQDPSETTSENESSQQGDSDEVVEQNDSKTEESSTQDGEEQDSNTPKSDDTTENTEKEETDLTEEKEEENEHSVEQTDEQQAEDDSKQVVDQERKALTEEEQKITENSSEEPSEELEEEADKEEKEEAVFKSSSVETPQESSTSRLGHLHGDAVIYSDLTNLSASVPAEGKYTNAVYYIKRQAELNGKTYYLISTKPSSTNGVVGWVLASDMNTYSHRTLDHQSKTFYIKGTGSAYSKTWGGSKDLVYGDLTGYKGQTFKVDLTETVGGNVWYRGTLDGRTVWLHSAYVTNVQEAEESSTSRLGHLRGDAVIYSDLSDLSSYESAAGVYTSAVYYIKKQAIMNDQTYYLISTKPSSVRGVIGWVKAKDMVTHTHKSVDHESKTFYVKGTGSAYSKAWGGPKDLVYGDLSEYKDQVFKVNLTESVGENIWYRGTLDGETVWLHSAYVSNINESSTSRLGHLEDSAVIFTNLGDLSSSMSAGAKYANSVYYIKKQAELNGQTYYLISTKPSSTNGVVGWVKAEDMESYSHKTIDSNSKTFYLRGTGAAYDKTWGDTNDILFSDLSSYKNQEFSVNLTESVGEDVWYRGNLNGKTVWVHASHVTNVRETATSRLGHFRGDAVIYPDLGDLSSSIPASDTYTNAVYYIKRQAQLDGKTYYLVSTKPSSVNGVVGWTEAGDMVTYSHTTADSKSKTFYIKGTGSAYSKAWGGAKDLVYRDLSSFSNQLFSVNLTEKVGNNTWYRGTLNGKTLWLHEAYLLNEPAQSYSTYNLSLAEALAIQMEASTKPQTDNEYDSYVSKNYIKDGKVTAETLNVRGGPGTNYWIVGQIKEGTSVDIVKELNGWYQIKYTEKHQWVNASPTDTLYYLDPNNFINDSRQQYQFLDLSKSNVASAGVLNNYLQGKGVLDGKGSVFLEAGSENGISEVYLVSHSLLETGHGTSDLATGVPVDKNGNVTFVGSEPGKTSATVTTVYNMYGIEAFDGCALTCGAKKAFNEGWDTPEKAIKGGASFIKDKYIGNGKNTIYKMRWNPLHMETYGYAGGQYATDIGWASKQIYSMYNLYQQLDSYVLYLDIPVYQD
ncbi:GW dipeptide domain-containing protein [Sediminibacillus massiliensis]|uniref:GW dipeptide domain-containing protein n=1 Tax=Sediminibacillus massiliensis TaxID=1926277 RepID=UPI00098837E9|nr:GW dipeptide domain-containing protein [Sediminibacillus massiliensis]